MDSILTSIKKMLGIDETYTIFDTDITININTVLMALSQLGVGPDTGFFISSAAETWPDFIGTRTDLEAIKTYIYLKVKMLFDPPTSSFVLDAMNRQTSEIEWRLNVQVENAAYTSTTTTTTV